MHKRLMHNSKVQLPEDFEDMPHQNLRDTTHGVQKSIYTDFGARYIWKQS